MVDIIKSDVAKKPLSSKTKPVPILKGISASSGFARGRVRVVNNLKDIKEIKPGEILVTTMTSPDYVPAMKIVSAIITDSGGITCHAAIVARELRKPCIVSTVDATRKLKTGDSVVVDAGTGKVYKIL